MTQLYYSFFFLLSLGIYFIFLSLMKMPTWQTKLNIRTIHRNKKKQGQGFEAFVHEIGVKISPWIKLSIYQRRKLQSILQSATIRESPEVYIGCAVAKAGIILIGSLPLILIFPWVMPVALFISIRTFFVAFQSADKIVKKKRDDIEYELPRFVATLAEELKANRNVLGILETYKKNAGDSLQHELEITTADMKSGNYESALIRLRARINSATFSEAIRGLIGVLNGDDGVLFFQMLAHDLKQLELQRLKLIAIKRPSKIKKYSFVMFVCFLLMYGVVLTLEIIKASQAIF